MDAFEVSWTDLTPIDTCVERTGGEKKYPDITAGDGIYSGYFSQYSDKPGMYSVTITATDQSAAARIPTVSYVAAEDCCGSSYPSVSTIPSPPFSRIVSGSSFYVGQGAQYFIHNGRPQMRDVFGPVRVTDLHVSQLVNTSLSVAVSWTLRSSRIRSISFLI